MLTCVLLPRFLEPFPFCLLFFNSDYDTSCKLFPDTAYLLSVWTNAQSYILILPSHSLYPMLTWSRLPTNKPSFPSSSTASKEQHERNDWNTESFLMWNKTKHLEVCGIQEYSHNFIRTITVSSKCYFIYKIFSHINFISVFTIFLISNSFQ